MKKKRLRLVTTIALLAALAGGSGGVAWGQAYKKGYVYSGNEQRQKLRRGDANSTGSKGHIKNAGNVNNEFGAGESAIVNSGSITFPAPSHGLNTNPSALRVGSEYSQNVVINIYDQNGGAAGEIRNVHFKNRGYSAAPTTWGTKETPQDRMFYSLLTYDVTLDPGPSYTSTHAGSYTNPTAPAGALIGSADDPPGGANY